MQQKVLKGRQQKLFLKPERQLHGVKERDKVEAYVF
jgi:hypothetical protein